MDTDDLSDEIYQGIMIEAERFNPDLTLQFGLLADSCKNEKQYLMKAKSLVETIRKLDKDALDDIFFNSQPNKKKLDLTRDKILANILKLEKA